MPNLGRQEFWPFKKKENFREKDYTPREPPKIVHSEMTEMARLHCINSRIENLKKKFTKLWRVMGDDRIAYGQLVRFLDDLEKLNAKHAP